MSLIRLCNAANLNKWDREPCDVAAIVKEWFNPLTAAVALIVQAAASVARDAAHRQQTGISRWATGKWRLVADGCAAWASPPRPDRDCPSSSRPRLLPARPNGVFHDPRCCSLR